MSRTTMKANFILGLAGLAMFLLASMSPSRLATALAQANSWSPQERIPGYDDDSSAPYLVADSNRTVHAFNAQEIDGDPVIVYSQWTLDQGWTTPVDILLLPGSYTDLGAFLDRTGMMHVVFYGPSDGGPNIYYSRALAMKAASAGAWSPAIPVGEDAASPASVALTGDDEGNLFVVYSGRQEGLGLYAVHSPDAGNTWSEPTIVFLTNSDTLWPFFIRMVLDDQGRLHVVWMVVNDDGIGEAVYYARLETDHLQWSTPVVLAERDEGDYSAHWPSIIAHNGEVFVVYQDGPLAPTRWFRRSSDGGETWTDPVRPFPHVGEYGDAVLLADRNDTLHIILGNRIGYPSTYYGMWHSLWGGDRWSDLEAIVSGARSKIPAGPEAPNPSGGGFTPQFPEAVISQGNVLLATWKNDHGFNGAWYSYMILDAPELPVMPLPMPPATPTATSTVTPTLPAPTPPPSPEPVLESHGDGSPTISSISSPTVALMAGVIPVVLLLSMVVAVHRTRRR